MLRLRKSRAAGRRACTHLPRSRSKVGSGLLEANFARHDFCCLGVWSLMHSTVLGQTKVRNTAGACGAETIIPVFFGGGAVVEILTIDTHTHIYIYIYTYIY